MRNTIIPALMGLFLLPIFLSTMGTAIISNPLYNKQSRCLFGLGIIVGQFVYSAMTSSGTGVIFMPTLDVAYLFKSISINIYKSLGDDSSECIIHNGNHLAQIALGNLISSLCAGVIALTNRAHLIYKIPTVVNLSIGLFTGVYYSICPLMLWDKTQKAVSVSNMVIQTAITLIGLVMYLVTGTPLVLAVWLLVIGVVSNLLRKYTDFAIIRAVFSDETMSGPFSVTHEITEIFKQFKLKLSLWRENIFLILSLACLNILMFSLSLVLYSKSTKAVLNAKMEFLAFAMANLLSLVSPLSLNYACSVLYILCGKTTRLTNLTTGVFFIVVFFTYHFYFSLIPTYLSLFIMQFIGFSYLKSYLPETLKLGYLDMSICIGFAALNYLNGGVLLVVILSLLFMGGIRFCVRRGIFFDRNRVSLEDGAKNAIGIPRVVDSINVQEVIGSIRDMHFKNMGKVILDFNTCEFIDLSGNLELRDFLNDEMIPYEIKGRARNLYAVK